MTGTQLSILIEKGIALGQLHRRGVIDRASYGSLLDKIHAKAEKYETEHFNLSTAAGRKKAQEHFATH
jgi:hypothetical protein